MNSLGGRGLVVDQSLARAGVVTRWSGVPGRAVSLGRGDEYKDECEGEGEHDRECR